jgi:hypothetical protein
MKIFNNLLAIYYVVICIMAIRKPSLIYWAIVPLFLSSLIYLASEVVVKILIREEKLKNRK